MTWGHTPAGRKTGSGNRTKRPSPWRRRIGGIFSRKRCAKPWRPSPGCWSGNSIRCWRPWRQSPPKRNVWRISRFQPCWISRRIGRWHCPQARHKRPNQRDFYGLREQWRQGNLKPFARGAETHRGSPVAQRFGSIRTSYCVEADGLLPNIVAKEQPCVVCDELACMPSCPTGALRVLDRFHIQMGTAKVDHHLCLREHGEDCTRRCAMELALPITKEGGIASLSDTAGGCDIHRCGIRPDTGAVKNTRIAADWDVRGSCCPTLPSRQ